MINEIRIQIADFLGRDLVSNNNIGSIYLSKEADL